MSYENLTCGIIDFFFFELVIELKN